MKRSFPNPILTREDIPAISPRVSDVSSVFNPGAIKIGWMYHLILRVQTRGRQTVLIPAVSRDGQTFQVIPKLVEIVGIEEVRETIFHIYDPRLTLIENDLFMVFAADTENGCRLGIARAKSLDDMTCFELVSFDTTQEARNGVLFPEKFDGKLLRLERPNRKAADSAGVMSGDEIVLSESDDLVTWTSRGSVMSGRLHYWDELIGSGPPPIKTRDGWLHIYHGVATHFASSNIYQAGVTLLDLDDPSRVIARGVNNILEPRAPYELTGQVPNVVFPSGMIVDGLDEEGFAPPEAMVRLYYGAADTCVGLATTTVGELIEAARLS